MKFFLQIKNLNANKGHGWGKIIRMIKLCMKTTAITVKLVFRSMLEKSVVPNDWKKNPCSSNSQKRLQKIDQKLSSY